MDLPTGTITLIGSGEFSETMGRAYRMVLARAPAEPVAVFLDTPAGFEVNADMLAAKARTYFSQHLNLTLLLASFKHKGHAGTSELEQAQRVLQRADLIVAGPGSPSYAVRHWHNTLIWDVVLARFQQGAHLILASAAAIAVGSCALPVYEIAKVGDDPHWINGLNIFGNILDVPLAIVPHWNNTEGGTYDTRFCFMGQARFAELERQLPTGTVVLGIDEYTACVFDLAARECHVLGAGGVTVRRDEQEHVWTAGETFSFAQLQGGAPSDLRARTVALDPPPRPLIQRAELVAPPRESDNNRGVSYDQMSAELLELLIQIRQELRTSEEYALADEIRERLARLNILIQDGSDGTTWRLAAEG